MNNDNKNRIKYGLKVFGLTICAILTIVVCVGIWNNGSQVEGIQLLASILLFFSNAVLIIAAGVAASKSYNAKIDELTTHRKI